GLRHGELVALKVGDVRLDEATPYLEICAATEKARRGARQPIPPSLASELRAWIKTREARLRRAGNATNGAGFLRLPLFESPPTIAVFNRDLRRAGIEKTDDH